MADSVVRGLPAEAVVPCNPDRGLSACGGSGGGAWVGV